MTSMLQIIELPAVASTNSELKDRSANQNLANWTVLSAKSQSAGRGQAGNTWETEPDKNIICSIFFRPHNIAADKQFILSKAIAVGIVRYLDSVGIAATIKWPNDIYVGSKKICGILIENTLIGNKINTSIAGIGLNLNQSVFSDRLPNPTSVKLETDQSFDRVKETEKLALSVQKSISTLSENSYEIINSDYHNLLYKKGILSLFKAKDHLFQGTIISVSDTGPITIVDETTKESQQFYFKEVEFCIGSE